MSTTPQDRNSFQVAIFCALPLEAENVQSVFDFCYEDQGISYGKAAGDLNTYTTGSIAGHNVVLVHLPNMGSNSAAVGAAGLRSSFPTIQLALVVGICGVVPLHPFTKEEIVLGDVVISTAMIHYGFGRQYPSGFRRKEKVEDSLGRAPPEIRSFINMMQVRQNRQRFNRKFEQLITSERFREQVPTAAYPGALHDRLYEASYVHAHRPITTCDHCLPAFETCPSSCDELGCGNDHLIIRNRHIAATDQLSVNHIPTIHLGRFGSADIVMKSGIDRDRISAGDEVTAFEMEGAGLWEQYPTVVIKAASDYADSHKNEMWQNYAAAMAAACLKLFLQEWKRGRQSPGPGEVSKTIQHVPFDAMPGFVGRVDELEKLEEKLLCPDSHQYVSLLGLGGVGKSRLALELLHRAKLKRPHWSIFWIQASERSTFENDILQIGKKLQIPGFDEEKVDFKTVVKQHLSQSSTHRWLMILDNADDETLWGQRSTSAEAEHSLVKYLPTTTSGSILITTRTRQVASFLSGKQVIKLGAITQDEAVKLFLSKIDEDHDSTASQSDLRTLVDKLARLPLAIVQAASYVNMTEIDIATYLDLLKQPESEIVRLLSKDFGDITRYPDAINPVANTWLISFERVQKRHILAAKLLSTMACFHEKCIPLSLLPNINSKIDLTEALAVLTGYSFVIKHSRTRNATNDEILYDMHRLVQLAARNWLHQEGVFTEWNKACVTRLATLFPLDNYEYKGLWTMYLPHAERVCEATATLALDSRYELLEKMGLCLNKDGNHGDAVRILRSVVNWREIKFNAADIRISIAYNNLGEALKDQGQYHEAKVYLEKAVERQSDLLGKTHMLTLMTMANVASVLCHMGRYCDAETLSREILRLRIETLGETHSATLSSMNGLAIVLNEVRKSGEAEDLLRKTLDIREKHLGMAHHSTRTSANNLAVTLNNQEKYDESEALLRRVLRSNAAILGEKHHETLISMNNLADVLAAQSRLVEAERMNSEVLKAREQTLGKTHPLTLVSISNLAVVIRKQGRYAEAEVLHRKALQLCEKMLGKTSPATLEGMSHLAIALWRQDKNVEAESLLREAIPQMQVVFGERHVTTVASMYYLIVVLIGLNRIEEVAKSMPPCIELLTDVFGPTDHLTKDTLKRPTELFGASDLTDHSDKQW